VFAYEWQTKELQNTECVRVANTGLTGGRFCAFDARDGALVVRTVSCRGIPPPVFLQKSAEVIENKGWESENERQESLRACKRKEIKKIKEEKEVEETKEADEVEEQRSASFVRGSGVRIGVRRGVRGWQARRENSFALRFISPCVGVA
jgi:hypothetical protein